MTDGHVIRLRGPWQFEDGERRGRIHWPADWAEVAAAERRIVAFTRVFHCPTGLTSSDRVLLEIADATPAILAVELNGQALEHAADPGTIRRFVITSQLQTQNRLLLRVDVSEGNACRPDVRLRIVAATPA